MAAFASMIYTHPIHRSKYVTCTTLCLQTICGSASLASDSLPHYLGTCIAILQLTLACIISVMGFLKLEARAEGHRSAGLSYNEIYRHLAVVLARRPCERPPVFALMENTEQALLQLEKIAPLVPSTICARTLKKESALKTFEMNDLPGEISILSPVEVYSGATEVMEIEVMTDSSDSLEAATYKPERRPSSHTPVPLNTLESPADVEAPSPSDKTKDEEGFMEAVTEV